MIQEKNGKLPPKKGKAKLPLLCGNGERIIPFYAPDPPPSHQRNATRQKQPTSGKLLRNKECTGAATPFLCNPPLPPQ